MFSTGFIAPNLGLAYIAAVLERDGHNVGVLDAFAEELTGKEIIARIRQFKPDLIGSGGQTPVSPSSLEIFRRVRKQISPDIVTVAGGPHFSFTDRESLETCDALDIVVRGEAEESLSEVCLALEKGQALKPINGITYRGPGGTIVCNPDRDPIADIESLPYPAWHLFPLDRYRACGIPFLAISSARGCNYRCPHCISWKMHPGRRLRDPVRVVDEMVWGKQTFGRDTFFFQDDVSFMQRAEMEAFLDALEACDHKLYWWYEAREDSLLACKDLWPRMKQNGLYMLTIGLESPDPAKRAQFGKDSYDPKEVEQMLATFEHDLDVLSEVYLLFGLPDDSAESMQQQLDYARHLYPDYSSLVVASLAVPFPGTDLYERLEEQQLITSHNWADYGFGKPVIRYQIPPEEVVRYFNRIWNGTFARPKVAWRLLRDLCSRNRYRRGLAKTIIWVAISMIKLSLMKDSNPKTL
jgi:radical SAM superfamily enzyme YgiQ (UPF0313 family)